MENGANTRAAAGYLNVKQPAISNEIRRNFFSQRIVDSWNNLPDTIKKSVTGTAFKNDLDDYKAW